MTTNGEYVTRAELVAHLDPMRRSIAAIGADVKELLSAQAGEEAVEEFRGQATRYRRWLIGTLLALLALVVGVGSSLATIYLQ